MTDKNIESAVESRVTDSLFRRYTSRAFLVWAVATYLIFEGKIDSSDWTILACVFIFMNFVNKCVDSTKVDSLAKLIEAVKP